MCWLVHDLLKREKKKVGFGRRGGGEKMGVSWLLIMGKLLWGGCWLGTRACDLKGTTKVLPYRVKSSYFTLPVRVYSPSLLVHTKLDGIN